MNTGMIVAVALGGVLLIGAVAFGAVFGKVGRAVDAQLKDFPERYAQAMPSTAKIVQVGGVYTSRTYGTTSVGLRLEVDPRFGPTYQAISVWEVKSTHAHDLEGKTVNIRIDRQNPKIIYSDENWASQPVVREYDELDFSN